jgi:toxin ParE1/3/4
MTGSVRQAAVDDILRQVERYVAQRLPKIAVRFHNAARTAIDAIEAAPETGEPQPGLPGLRRRPVKGFDDYWIYYQAQPDTLDILRVLHGTRDLARIPSSKG